MKQGTKLLELDNGYHLFTRKEGKGLKNVGIDNVTMLTGDKKIVGESVAEKLAIPTFLRPWIATLASVFIISETSIAPKYSLFRAT